MVSEISGPGVGGVAALNQRGTKIGEARGLDAPHSAQGKGADVVTLTDLAARLSELTKSVENIPVADREKIEAFRQEIAGGNYEIDSHAIAEKLTAIESLLANVNQVE